MMECANAIASDSRQVVEPQGIFRQIPAQRTGIPQLHQQAAHEVGTGPGQAVIGELRIVGVRGSLGVRLHFHDVQSPGTLQLQAERFALLVFLHQTELQDVDDYLAPVGTDSADSRLFLGSHLDLPPLAAVNDPPGPRVGEFHDLEQFLGAVESYATDHDWGMGEVPEDSPRFVD